MQIPAGNTSERIQTGNIAEIGCQSSKAYVLLQKRGEVKAEPNANLPIRKSIASEISF